MWGSALEDKIIPDLLICLVTEGNVPLVLGFPIKKVYLFALLEANIWSLLPLFIMQQQENDNVFVLLGLFRRMH